MSTLKESLYRLINTTKFLMSSSKPSFMNLSKSNFKIAQTCATKLYYTKNKYPSLNEGNEYLEILAEGGYMVGKLAQLLYPEGIEVKTENGTGYAIEETEKLLASHKNITLFEAAISVNDKIIRIDILKKTDTHFDLIEVKSKSIDSRLTPKGLPKKSLSDKEYVEYLEDVAFQKLTLQERFPSASISSFLLVPDKVFVSNLDGILSWFKLRKEEAKPGSTFKKIEVDFIGTEEQLDLIRLPENRLLALKQVDDLIQPWLPRIAEASKKYIQSLVTNTKIETSISIACRDCEFRVKENELKNGFKECWGPLAEPRPHILDLSQLGNINRRDDVINDLIKRGKAALQDIPVEALQKADGSSYYSNRPLYQCTKTEEFLLPGLWEELQSQNLHYPLHFIDFETSQMALPFNSNMRCYENVIFQWSCHTISHKGAAPVHREWINTDSAYPNLEFAEQLRACIGDTGSVLIWSKYENTQLKAILKVMEELNHADHDLMQWLQSVILEDNNDSSNRMIDLHDLAKKYYFHPLMGGRTSIKVALPSVLYATKSDLISTWLKDLTLLEYDADGHIKNPYKLLPEEYIQYGTVKLNVQDGSAAMRTYQDMVYGLNRDNAEIKEKYRQALLQYCRLDTLAMVIIWEHWMDLLKRQN